MPNKEPRIIIVNGPGGSGKDTLIGQLAQVAKENNRSIEEYSTITDVKKMLTDAGYLMNSAKSDAARNLMYSVKKALIEYSDAPFVMACCAIDVVDDMIAIHCREGSEITKFIEKYNDRVYTLYIRRSDVPVPECKADQETECFFGYDFEIIDCPMHKLKDKAQEVFDKIK